MAEELGRWLWASTRAGEDDLIRDLCDSITAIVDENEYYDEFDGVEVAMSDLRGHAKGFSKALDVIRGCLASN